MEAFRTDSPVPRRIVAAFLHFLKSVEPAPNVDMEGINVAKDCLEEIFGLRSLSAPPADDVALQAGLLVDLFTAMYACDRYTEQIGNSDASVHNMTGALSRDELYEKFYHALDEVNFFSNSPGEDEDAALLWAKATRLFNEAYIQIENSGKQVHPHDLAELFKLKGNQSLHLRLFSEAIGLYTCAIALCDTNAVYFCNRAAAFINIHRHAEAIEDCLKSIEINPNYVKAYRRLGRAYLYEGKYFEALTEGFNKALELDPNDETLREELRVTQQLLRNQPLQPEEDMATESRNFQGSTGPSNGRTNKNRPFAMHPEQASLPPELAGIFESMASASAQGHQTNERPPSGSADEWDIPDIDINLGSNGRLELGQMPQIHSEFLTCVMEMFGEARLGPESPDEDPTTDNNEEN